MVSLYPMNIVNSWKNKTKKISKETTLHNFINSTMSINLWFIKKR